MLGSDQGMATQNLDNPFFARLWALMSTHESQKLTDLRKANLAGLTGRVLEVGAGIGTNFALYPSTVAEVVALEPEIHMVDQARQAAAAASVPVSVIPTTVEALADVEPFDAVVCSLVLCSVGDPDAVLRDVHALLKPGGELRFFEHIATGGLRGGLQRVADATVWPRISGNCHTHRDTERSIIDAGFVIETSRMDRQFPAWVPTPVSEVAVGRARKAG
jgi:SAM-dependent methyltransferase